MKPSSKYVVFSRITLVLPPAGLTDKFERAIGTCYTMDGGDILSAVRSIVLKFQQ